MAKTLIIYPYADITIQHSKSNTSSTAANLINEVSQSENGYIGHTFSSASTTTYVSSFSSLTQSSSVTLGKLRINSISSVNLYLELSKSSNASLSDVNIFGSVTINGNTYRSASYNPTGAVSTSLRTLEINNANINRRYSSLAEADIRMSLSSSGKYTSTDYKSANAYCRFYNVNVTISYDDVFSCAVQYTTGTGITTASVSSNEVIDGDLCTFSATLEDGYIFDGWYDNEEFDGDPYSTDLSFTLKISENTTLYPKAQKEGVVPPEEDPTKIFYPVTISAINARTSPSKGTTKIESGTNKTIKITPKDPLLTLATDNGTDITQSLVGHGTPIQYPGIATAPSASYGFNLNSTSGYYVSTNGGQSNSAAVCRLSFNFPVECLVTIQYINYAEAGNDFGIFGNIDVALATSNTVDTNAKLVCNNPSYNIPTPQTLTYEMNSGQHYVDIKYRKNATNDLNNDSLQFKVLSIEPLEVHDFYYTYELQNVSQEHTLNFVFGNVEYYFVTSQTDSNAQLYPYGQTVVLSGDEYRLTIVPENQNEIVNLTDNGVDVSSQMEVIHVETEEGGETVTIINYIYKLSNVQAAHNLNVQTTKLAIPQSIKLNNTWTRGNFFYKVNGAWVGISLADIYSHNEVKWIRSKEGIIKANNVIFFGNIS